MTEQKPFKYERYWTRYAEDTMQRPPSLLAEMLFDVLPEAAENLTVLELGASNGRDSIVFGADPRISKVITVDPIPVSALIITAKLQGAQAMKASGQISHFADIEPRTMRIEDMTEQNTPAADALPACGVFMYVEQDRLEQQMAMLLRKQKPGNVFIANFAAEGADVHAASYDTPTIACISAEALRKLLDGAGYEGEIIPSDETGRPTKPGEDAIMYIVAAQKAAATPMAGS